MTEEPAADPPEPDPSEPEPAAPLETGWFFDTPVDDTLTRQFVIADGEWMESCALAAGQACLRTDDFLVVDDHSPHPLLNTGVLLRPVVPDRAAEVAAGLMRFFDGAGGPFSVFSPLPAELPGLTAAGHPPLLLRVPGGERPAVPPELTIEEATTRDALADYEQVLVEGFPLESLQPWRAGVVFHRATLHVPGTRFFVARVDGRAVSVAMSIVGCGVNHVEFVATLPAARGRGYGEAVTWEATLADPTIPAMLIATDMGRRVYERMGYVAITRWTFFVGER
jgi:GNAT superfamily N-acetyltransferase